MIRDAAPNEAAPMSPEPTAASILRAARRRLAFARFVVTPAVVALWLAGAYAVFLAVMIAWTILTNLPDPGAGEVRISGPGRIPVRVTEKGKSYEGDEAREKLGERLRQRGVVPPKQGGAARDDDRALADRFVGGLLTGFTWALMIVFLVIAVPVAVLATYMVFFFVPFALTLPLSAGLALSWTRPARLLLLRPFRKRETNRPLRKIIARRLAGLGHTYTLADADIRVPLYIRIPVLAGQLSFFAFHRRRVRKPEDIESLAHVMGRRFWRNINWCVSPGRVFPVASDDGCWQDCVRRLTSEVDLILFEISDVDQRPNLLWELDLCAQAGCADRVFFLVGEAQRAEAQEYLESRGWPGPATARVFVHDNGRLVNEAEFGAVAASLLAARGRS